MIDESGPKPKKPDEIASPEEMAAGVSLFADVEDLLKQITADKYFRPPQEPVLGVKNLGEATDRMKQLYTLHSNLSQQVDAANRSLRGAGPKGNEEIYKTTSTAELQRRATEAALGYEVGKVFKLYGMPFGIDVNWNVYTQKTKDDANSNLN